jgi:hypothetical protein
MIAFLVLVSGAKVSGHAGFSGGKIHHFFFPAGKLEMKQFIAGYGRLH